MANFAYPDQVFEALETQMALRKKRLLEAAEQANQEIRPPQSQMVSGRYVAPSWAQSLHAAIQPTMARMQEQEEQDRLNALQANYRRADNAARAAFLQGQPRVAVNDQGQTEYPTSEQTARWLDTGRGIPSLRDSVAKAFDYHMTRGPELEKARASKKADLERGYLEKAHEAGLVRDAQAERARESQAETLKRQREHDETLRVIAAGRPGPQPQRDRFQLVTDASGQTSRVNLDTGEVTPMGQIGKGTGTAKDKPAENKANVMRLITDAEKHLETATGSGIGSLRDTIAAQFGYGTEGAESSAALKVIAGELTSAIERMPGAVSNADLVFLKEQVGNIGNEKLPNSVRLKALQQVKEKYNRIAGPAVGAIENGYRFKGGDPSQASNWERAK